MQYVYTYVWYMYVHMFYFIGILQNNNNDNMKKNIKNVFATTSQPASDEKKNDQN